jgi:hypothetical protein
VIKLTAGKALSSIIHFSFFYIVVLAKISTSQKPGILNISDDAVIHIASKRNGLVTIPAFFNSI